MWQIFRERTIECFVATIHEFSLPSESLLALDLCARLSTRRPFPDDQPGTAIGNAIVLNAEDSAQDTTRPRLQALGANLERVFVPLQTDRDSAELFRLPGGIPQLDSALKRTQARLVVFDPLVAFLDPSISANSDQVVAARFQRAKAQEIGT